VSGPRLIPSRHALHVGTGTRGGYVGHKGKAMQGRKRKSERKREQMRHQWNDTCIVYIIIIKNLYIITVVSPQIKIEGKLNT
jgi:hypothetical protein